MPAYDTKQHAVDALVPGAKIVGEAPYSVKVANPKAGLAGEPAQIDQTQGTTLSIQDKDGNPDTIVVSDAKPVDSGGGKGGIGYEVITGPQKAPTKTSTPAAGLERLDANLQPIPEGSSTATVYVRDPKAPPGTTPFKVEGDTATLGDPSTWTPIRRDQSDPASEVIGLYDPQSKKVAASVSAPPGAKPSGVYTNIIDPNDPAGKRVIAMVDTGNKAVTQVQATPDGTQIIQTPTAIYQVNKDTGASTKIQDLDPAAVNKQAVTVGGKVYTFDPKDGSFTLPTNVQTAATVGNSSTIKDLIWYDDQGNEVGRQPNPNYGKAPVTAPTPNTVAPMIQVPESQVTPGGDPSKLVWIQNQGQVTASDALKQVASHLSGQVIDGKMSVDEAKALIDASNAKMTNDINQQNADNTRTANAATAANDVLRQAGTNAQTGAGMLNQRVSSATGALNSLIGAAAGSKMTSVPAGLGQQLVGGLQDWVTDLGGGQATYDTAARMVQAADPKISQDPTLANQAQTTLAQMFQQYQAQTGQPHPLVAATQAANASSGANGMVAPVTAQQTNVQQPNLAATAANVVNSSGFNPQASTAALNARGLLDNPQGRAIAAGQTPVAAGGAPQYPGQYNLAYQQGIVSPVGMPSVGPNAANGFIAPLIPV